MQLNLQLAINSEITGRLIGKGGSRINALRSESGASFKIESEERGGFRVCHVGGLTDQIVRLLQDAFSPPTERSEDEVLDVRLLVPSQHVGGIIGRGGGNVAQIRQESGAQIQIERTPPGQQDEFRSVEVRGSCRQLRTALTLMVVKIEEERSKLQDSDRPPRDGGAVGGTGRDLDRPREDRGRGRGEPERSRGDVERGGHGGLFAGYNRGREPERSRGFDGPREGGRDRGLDRGLDRSRGPEIERERERPASYGPRVYAGYDGYSGYGGYGAAPYGGAYGAPGREDRSFNSRGGREDPRGHSSGPPRGRDGGVPIGAIGGGSGRPSSPGGGEWGGSQGYGSRQPSPGYGHYGGGAPPSYDAWAAHDRMGGRGGAGHGPAVGGGYGGGYPGGHHGGYGGGHSVGYPGGYGAPGYAPGYSAPGYGPPPGYGQGAYPAGYGYGNGPAPSGAYGPPAGTGHAAAASPNGHSRGKRGLTDEHPAGVLVMEMHNDFAGRIIGRGGQTISSIRRNCGGRLEVREASRTGGGDRVVVIDGSEAEVDSIISEVFSHIGAPRDGPDDRARAAEERPVEVVLVMPSFRMGAVIGHGGGTIASIRSETGVRFRVDPGNSMHKDTERTAFVAGTADQVLQALRMVARTLFAEGKVGNGPAEDDHGPKKRRREDEPSGHRP